MLKHSLITAIIALALLTYSARSQDLGGQPGSYAVNGDDSLVVLMPELRTAKAPQWLKPGIRLTWYSASATVAVPYVGNLIQDRHGLWRDPATGRTFRCDENAAGSGHGYTIMDVIAVHDDVVVIAYSVHGIQGLDGPLTLAMTGGYSTPSGYLSSYWLNPDVLVRHADLAGEGIQSARLPYTCAGRQYDAFWYSITNGNGAASYIMDLASGLMLHTGMASAGAPNAGGGTNLAQVSYLGMRQLQIPWAGAPMPAAIANVRKLAYQGTMTFSMPGAFPLSFPYTSEYVVTGRGKDFLQGRWSTVLDYGNGMPPVATTVESVNGCNQLLPLAIPPEHLARLERGQVLDRDPVLKSTLAVAFVGRDARGNDVVVISGGQGEGFYREDSIYDRNSGILVGVIRTDPSNHSETKLFLTARE